MCSCQNPEIGSQTHCFYLFVSSCANKNSDPFSPLKLSLSPRHLHFRLSKVELKDFVDRSQKSSGQLEVFWVMGVPPNHLDHEMKVPLNDLFKWDFP